MGFQDYLRLNVLKIDEQLDLILAQFLTEVKSKSSKLIPFALGFINSCKGGKRIRGTLVKLGYEIGSGVILSATKDLSRMRDSDKLRDSSPAPESVRGQNDILKIAAATEILHAAILIHDDVIDQSPTRRAKPSLFKHFGGGHKGESLAIGIGDLGLYLPIQIIADANFLGEYKIKAFAHLSQTMVNTAWGQVLEIETQGSATSKDINLIQRLKTAYYTISGPLILGAILAGGDKKMLGMLEKFGENLGIAFQIQDDILDNEIDYIGGVLSGKKEALKYASLAKKIIPDITKDEGMSTLLEQMCEYVVERRK